jgi:hypothetical protein
MHRRIWSFLLEGWFVLGVLILLKRWIFPFFLQIWFPVGDTASLLAEWTAIMVGCVALAVYIGLGSSAKDRHQFTLFQSLVSFALLHSVLFIPSLFLEWHRLINDLFALFRFPLREHPILFLLPLLFFVLGRTLQMQERESGGEGNVQGRKIREKG